MAIRVHVVARVFLQLAVLWKTPLGTAAQCNAIQCCTGGIVPDCYPLSDWKGSFYATKLAALHKKSDSAVTKWHADEDSFWCSGNRRRQLLQCSRGSDTSSGWNSLSSSDKAAVIQESRQAQSFSAEVRADLNLVEKAEFVVAAGIGVAAVITASPTLILGAAVWSLGAAALSLAISETNADPQISSGHNRRLQELDCMGAGLNASKVEYSRVSKEFFAAVQGSAAISIAETILQDNTVPRNASRMADRPHVTADSLRQVVASNNATLCAALPPEESYGCSAYGSFSSHTLCTRGLYKSVLGCPAGVTTGTNATAVQALVAQSCFLCKNRQDGYHGGARDSLQRAVEIYTSPFGLADVTGVYNQTWWDQQVSAKGLVTYYQDAVAAVRDAFCTQDS